MKWLAAISVLPIGYIFWALLQRDWERWLTPRKLAPLFALGIANSLAIVYLFEMGR